jgi:hypothetical protein
MLGRGKPAATAFLTAGLVLAALAAGCSRQSATSRASVQSCVQFGIAAIRHHVTVTSRPPACLGLTGAQIDFSVGSALRSAAIGARGKVRQRERIGQASQYLEHLVVSVPAQLGEPQVLTPAAPRLSRTTLGLIALFTWLITVALGLWMMIRWILRSRARHPPGSRLRRPPALDLAHLGLASASLLTWIAYLASGVIGLAWTASALLPLVAGLGMALVFLPPSVRRAATTPAHALPAAIASEPARGNSSQRRPPVVTVGAHIIFATATILLALLTAIGVG